MVEIRKVWVIHGTTRAIAVSGLIPAEWRYVEVTKEEEGKDYVVLKVRKVA